MKDDLGDRMKAYEAQETSRKFMPLLPVVARLDGRCFSNFTYTMDRPYDVRMIKTMQETAERLVKETGADIGYTQSDEITLIWNNNSLTSQVFFNGKIFKLISLAASLGTVYFNRFATNNMPGLMVDKAPVFDCRVYQTPNLMEAYNSLIWREQDAIRNSVQSLARSKFSHKECHRKNCKTLKTMLLTKGINWHDYPTSYKCGTYYAKRRITRPYTDSEVTSLPSGHPAKQDPEFSVERSVVQKLDLPAMSSISNKIEVFRDGAIPIEKVSDEHGNGTQEDQSKCVGVVGQVEIQ